MYWDKAGTLSWREECTKEGVSAYRGSGAFLQKCTKRGGSAPHSMDTIKECTKRGDPHTKTNKTIKNPTQDRQNTVRIKHENWFEKKHLLVGDESDYGDHPVNTHATRLTKNAREFV